MLDVSFVVCYELPLSRGEHGQLREKALSAREQLELLAQPTSTGCAVFICLNFTSLSCTYLNQGTSN